MTSHDHDRQVDYIEFGASDIGRTKQFYQTVFGWKFQPWGPPGFFLVATGDKNDPGVPGALQKRHELVPGQRMNGYECTIGVDDIDVIRVAVDDSSGVNERLERTPDLFALFEACQRSHSDVGMRRVAHRHGGDV